MPAEEPTMEDRFSKSVQTVILSYVLLLAGLAIHEVAHLVVLFAFGKTGTLIIVPWRFGIADYYIWGLHVEPSPPLTVADQTLLNFFGPIIAIVPFAFLLRYVKERIPRVAILANIFVLIFFAILEAGYEVLEFALKRGIGILGSPEFNIGVPMLIFLIMVYMKIWRAPQNRETS